MELKNVIAQRKNKTIYRSGDLAIKVFDKEFSKSDILNEALNQARVEETGLNIPRIKEVTVIEGKWAIVSEFIDGKTLAQIMEEDRKNISKYIENLVYLQLEMHGKKSSSLNKLKDKMERKIKETNLDATTKYELHTRLESMPKHTKVCHGDFNPSNIIIDNEGCAFIIDWSHATQGNASADAARTYLLFSLAGDKEAADLYIDMFCKKSDTAKQYVQQWLPIVAASQLVKGNEQERAFLMNWLNVVDYQ